MPTLKQRNLAYDLAQGDWQIDAYCKNYNTSRDRSYNGLLVEASRACNNPKVQLMVKEHVDKAFDGVDIKEYVLDKLKKQVETGKNEGATGQALKLLGQTQAMFTEKVETSERTMSMDDLISNLAGDDDTLKAQLQARFGVDTTH